MLKPNDRFETDFNKIFGTVNAEYRKGMDDRLNNKEKQSNDPEYLKGFAAQEDIEEVSKRGQRH